METSMEGAVFVQTNAAHNEVIAFSRAADGSLAPAGTFATGGAGDGNAHLPSQGSVTLTRDRRHLLVTNVASNDVSVFAVNGGMLELTKTVPVGAGAAEHRGARRSRVRARHRRRHDQRVPPRSTATLCRSTVRIGTLSTPDGAQVGFTPDGRALIATERGGDKLSAFAVGKDGMLGEARTIDSLGATPYGFAISPNGTLVVTEAFRAEKGAAAASSYRVDGDAITPGTASVGNGRSEICWAVISNDGRYAFTTNFADGAVSRYAIGMPAASSPSRTPPPASPRTGARAFATRICPTTVGSCTRSTPTRARSSGGPWTSRVTSRWPARGSGVPTTVAGLAAS